MQRQDCVRTCPVSLISRSSLGLDQPHFQRRPPTPAQCPWDLPSVARERHCPVMGLYSWLSSAQTHRKDPSTFSQKASPHTPLSSSHSFTSGKESTDPVRCVSRQLLLYLLCQGRQWLLEASLLPASPQLHPSQQRGPAGRARQFGLDERTVQAQR